jgi:predicted TIM-barrel enzyme
MILLMLYNVSAEFADSLDRRPLPDRARSAVFSSIPDAVLVSGQITGEAAAMSDLEAVKKALPEHAGAGQYRRQARHHRRCACDCGWLCHRLGA